MLSHCSQHLLHRNIHDTILDTSHNIAAAFPDAADREPGDNSAQPGADPLAVVPGGSLEAGSATQGPGGMNGNSEADAALAPPGGREVMVAIRIAVRPDLPGPIRGVCVDLDIHRGLGDVLSVSLPPQIYVHIK